MQIVHGDNQIASRNYYLSLKDKARTSGDAIFELNGADISLSDLITASTSVSLLASQNIVFIDGLFSRRPSTDKKSLIDYLLHNQSLEIYLYDSKDISTQLKSFDQKLIKKFDLPRYVFEFVDSLSLPLFHKSLTSSEPEMILGMIAKRIHDLIQIQEHQLSLPAWQQSKLEAQAKKYTLSQLVAMNSQLLEIDFKQKTSSSPYDLTVALEIWLLKNNPVIANVVKQS